MTIHKAKTTRPILAEWRRELSAVNAAGQTVTSSGTESEDIMQYFEIEFTNNPEDDAYGDWICIRGMREPTVTEAAEFCKKDAEMFGKPLVGVYPLTEDEARSFYDFDNVKNWPIFGI